MKFGDYKSKTPELTESTQKIGRELIGNIQPQKGKPAVNGDGLAVSDSVVLSNGLVALSRTGEIILVDVKTTNIVASFDKSDLKFLRKLK